jgi:putative oxidoreductase
MRLDILDRYRPAILGLARIALGLLFLEHGLQKLFGLLGGVGAPGQSVPLFSEFGLAGVLELVGGLLIALGLLTRPVALLLVGQMLVAFFQVHAPQGGFPVQNGGELALLYAVTFLFVVVAGPGRWSVDGVLGKDGSENLPASAPRSVKRAA